MKPSYSGPKLADSLLDELFGKVRVIRAKRIETKYYFDADLFRFYFRGRDGKPLQQWRDEITEQARKAEIEGSSETVDGART